MFGHFPYRLVLQEVHNFAVKKPGKIPTDHDYNEWAWKVSNVHRVPPRIVIAATADKISRRGYMALIGGANHEAFHRLYSGQERIEGADLKECISPYFRPDIKYQDPKIIRFLAFMQNIFEDIRIERIGCREFPGVYTKMCDLADFILDQEAPLREKDLTGDFQPSRILMMVIREVGLGYSTVKTREALEHYNRVAPEVVALLKSGPLAPLLERAIPKLNTDLQVKKARTQVGLALSLAFQMMAILSDTKNLPNPPEPEPPKDSEPKEPEDSEGDSEDEDESDDVSDDEDSEGESDDEDSDGASDDEDSVGESDEDSEGESEDDAEGESEDEAEGESEDEAEGESEDEDGGSKDNTNEDPGEPTAELISKILNSSPDGMMDYASALEDLVQKQEMKEDLSLGEGEKPFRPFSTSGDKIVLVKGNEKENRRKLALIVNATKRETAYLRSKLRNMFRALESVAQLHGVKKGRTLSERYLVDTYATIRSGQDPTRAFTEESETIDTSIGAFIVLDESSSMRDKLIETSSILYTLGDGLDSIGAKFAIAGFRDGEPESFFTQSLSRGYHRTTPIHHDIFKGFDERYRDVAWRLGSLIALGSTPMADGVELALRSLSERKEGHRVIFVVTDGQPDCDHTPVLKHQFRRAAEAGIHIIGVGLGEGSVYVTTLFPDYVYSEKLVDMPKLLVQKLEKLVLKIGTSKRGLSLKGEKTSVASLH